jgi:hypothetical protein
MAIVNIFDCFKALIFNRVYKKTWLKYFIHKHTLLLIQKHYLFN